MTTKTHTNRLIHETSPYLVQHAHNPVDWFPWGEEAFAEAKKHNRPIFLSIGYSTCHWCHVMAHESFEDEEIARYLNDHFISIKVDREERPDIDATYMTAVQLITGAGGWPMSVWLDPDKKPFFGGTYFPARNGDRGAGKGFLSLLKDLKEMYDEDPSRIARASAQLVKAVQASKSTTTKGELDYPQALASALQHYKNHYDPISGGISGAPKFPSSLPIRTLLCVEDKQLLAMATHTLQKMAEGGIYDQLAGGFHRYATDAQWQIPHFEKMLYDNALQAIAYVEGYQATGLAEFAFVATDILQYLQRDMMAPSGGFYAATDADSLTPDDHLDEGYYFTWTPKELEDILGQDAQIVKAHFGVTEEGSFEGRNILHLTAPLSLPSEKIDRARSILLLARNKRPQPHRDEKIMTSWNGLTISAFAKAGLVLKRPEFVQIARDTADWIWQNCFKEGVLFHSRKDGKTGSLGFLDDYAFLCAGLIDLYEATKEMVWLKRAVELDDILRARFEDEEAGGFFMTSDAHEKLLVREKPSQDGAEPSGNSVHALNLLRLSGLSDQDTYRQRACSTIEAFSDGLTRYPQAFSNMLIAVHFMLTKPMAYVCEGAACERPPLSTTKL